MRQVLVVAGLGLMVAASPAGAIALNCGAGVDPRFPEASALCGPIGQGARAPFAAVVTRDTTSVPFSVRRSTQNSRPEPVRSAARIRPGDHAPMIHAVARSYRVDPRLLAAMVHAESGGRPGAVSHKGALGLMQVMPATARGLGVRDPATLLTSPALALSTGALYLKTLQAKFGNNLPLVVAAYNAGPGAVTKAGRRIPAYRETQTYVGKVLSRYASQRRP